MTAWLVGQSGVVVLPEIVVDPVGDALAGHAQDLGDSAYQCAPIDLEDRQGPSGDGDISCLPQLAEQSPTLPCGLRPSSFMGISPYRRGYPEPGGCQKAFAYFYCIRYILS